MARHKYSELRNRLSPAARARAQELAKELRAELPLHELRRARQLTQVQVAEQLGIPQGSVSKLEKRTDLYLSTLRRFIEAMGGQLRITACFPDGEVVISNLGEENERSSTPAR